MVKLLAYTNDAPVVIAAQFAEKAANHGCAKYYLQSTMYVRNVHVNS